MLKTSDALDAAIEAMTMRDNPADDAAIATLKMIRDQRGCEHLDCCEDGRLTTFIDVVVFG